MLQMLQATSLPRERVKDFQNEAQRYIAGVPQAWDRYGARAAVDGIGSQVRNMSVQQQAAGCVWLLCHCYCNCNRGPCTHPQAKVLLLVSTEILGRRMDWEAVSSRILSVQVPEATNS